MGDLCNDNRFELIEKYKKELIEATNIETVPNEMAVLDNILFRFWQMGWLDKLAQPERAQGEWIDKKGLIATCSKCGDRWGSWRDMKYCPTCGVEMNG